jgi:hypothetical protein
LDKERGEEDDPSWKTGEEKGAPEAPEGIEEDLDLAKN